MAGRGSAEDLGRWTESNTAILGCGTWPSWSGTCGLARCGPATWLTPGQCGSFRVTGPRESECSAGARRGPAVAGPRWAEGLIRQEGLGPFVPAGGFVRSRAVALSESLGRGRVRAARVPAGAWLRLVRAGRATWPAGWPCGRSSWLVMVSAPGPVWVTGPRDGSYRARPYRGLVAQGQWSTESRVPPLATWDRGVRAARASTGSRVAGPWGRARILVR